jgi:hypothetical protein
MGVMLIGPAVPVVGVTPPLTVTRIENGTLYLNNYIMADNAAAGDTVAVTNYFPLVRGYQIADATVEGLTLDLAAPGTDQLAGLRIGGVWLGFCQRCTLRGLVIRGTLGDGILTEACENILGERCESSGNTHHGLHYGSHTLDSRVLDCNLHDNGSDGLYLCWGIRRGVFRGNEIHHNGYALHRNGISIGHKDTDNLIENNHIHDNAKHGLCFRKKTEANGAHRNIVRGNLIENNGRPKAEVPEKFYAEPRLELMYAGVFVSGITHDLLLENNTFRETRTGDRRLQVNAVYLAPGVSKVKMAGNKFEGLPGPNVVDESGAKDNQLQ